MWSCSGAGIPGVSRGTQQIPAQGAQTQQGLPRLGLAGNELLLSLPLTGPSSSALPSSSPAKPTLGSWTHTAQTCHFSVLAFLQLLFLLSHTVISRNCSTALGFSNSVPISFRKPWGALQSSSVSSKCARSEMHLQHHESRGHLWLHSVSD